MSLRIKSQEVAKLAADVASMTGEDKTQAVRNALEERLMRLTQRFRLLRRRGDMIRYLESEGGPVRKANLTAAEVHELLGYGPDLREDA